MTKNHKKTGILFGTFDIFHPGHQNLFTQAKKYCDYLIVVIARDETVKRIKNKKPINNENKRKIYIKNNSIADQVILGSLKDKHKAIKHFQPDFIFLGYDQINFISDLNSIIKLYNKKTKIIKLNPYKPEIYKTSLIIKKDYYFNNKQKMI